MGFLIRDRSVNQGQNHSSRRHDDGMFIDSLSENVFTAVGDPVDPADPVGSARGSWPPVSAAYPLHRLRVSS